MLVHPNEREREAKKIILHSAFCAYNEVSTVIMRRFFSLRDGLVKSQIVIL